MTGTECNRLHDLAPELALGLLDGAERAEALAHLERCAKCHADVASLTELGERLLLLAPGAPPPAGFESRVLERVQVAEDAVEPAAAPRGHRRRASRVLVAVAAAVVLVVAVVGVLVATSGDGGPAVAASVVMENRRGDAIGTVDLLEGSPPTVRLDLAEWAEEVATWDDPPEGPWHLAVYDDSGRMESYALPDYDSTPDVRLSHGDPETVHHVSVLDGEGRVWCTGEFG